MTRLIGYRPLMAAALAGVMALSAGAAMAQRHRDNGWHGGPPPGHSYDRGRGRGHDRDRDWDRGRRGYRGDYGRDNTGAIVGGALLGLGVLGGALALQQSQVAPPPAYYVPPPAYAPPDYGPPPGYYGYK